jgi:hypothetical protein
VLLPIPNSRAACGLLLRFALHGLQRFGSFENLFLVKEKLFTCREHKLSLAIPYKSNFDQQNP